MFTIPAAPSALQVTPVVVDGVMYVTSVNEAYALDARSGLRKSGTTGARARQDWRVTPRVGSIAAWQWSVTACSW